MTDLVSETWTKSKKLREAGLEYKDGKFTAEEKRKLDEAVEAYKEEHGLSNEQMQILIYKRRNAQLSEDHRQFIQQHKNIWKDIALALPNRTVESQYRYVQRKYDALNKKGKWSADEDQMLQELVVTHGMNWVHIALQVGRTAAGCADRWKILERTQQDKQTGKWTPEEENKYNEAYERLLNEGRNPDPKDRNFWETIAAYVESRTYLQCRQKWSRIPTIGTPVGTPAGGSPEPEEADNKPARWNHTCDDVLLFKLRNMQVHDDSEIDWKTVRDETLPWPAPKIRQAFLRLKARVPEAESRSFDDLVQAIGDYIAERTAKREKRNTPSTNRRRAPVLSDERVGDEDEDEEEEEEDGEQHDHEEGYYEEGYEQGHISGHYYGGQGEEQEEQEEGAEREYAEEEGEAQTPVEPAGEGEKKKKKKRKVDEDPEERARRKERKRAKREAKEAKREAKEAKKARKAAAAAAAADGDD